jgi:hypothetical protein
MIHPSFAPAPSQGVNLHRVINPALEIPQARLLPQDFTDLPTETTHIVINAAYANADTIKQLRSTGLKLVIDIDDFWIVPKNHSNYASLKASNYIFSVPYAIKAADVVWCASKLLVDECRKINKNSHYIPNTYGNQWKAARGTGTRFGYVATAADHLKDAELMQKAFKRLGKEASTAQIGWCGYRPTDQDLKMRQIIESAGNCFIGQFLPASNYWWHFNSFDTALAPLQATDFNNHKSALKAIEAGAMGCAFICSDSPVYKDFEHGTNCLKAKTPMDWYRNITNLHQNPNMALDLSANLQEYVNEMFNPKYWAAQRLQTLEG